MADATISERLRLRAVLLAGGLRSRHLHCLAPAERPDGRGVRGVVLDATTTGPPQAAINASTLLLHRVSTRLRRFFAPRIGQKQ
jgi:hypothetical protein